LEINDWEPENYGGRRYGRVTLSEAFAQSINTAAVRLAQEVGLNEVIAAANDLGIEDPLPTVPSLALGAVDIGLLDLTAAYASVMADKMDLKPWGISGFGTAERNPGAMKPATGATRSLQPYRKPIIEMLQLVVREGTGRAASLGGFAAGKTGTSEDYRDAWFVGFNEALITGVWVGNDDRTPMNKVTGGSLPAEIWQRFMSKAMVVAAKHESHTIGSASAGEHPLVQCDYSACARAYDSFRAVDCTYQPYDGPRKVCERNLQVVKPEASELMFQPGASQCNYDHCSKKYDSFNPSDCTYQPYGGGRRRLCDK
jgi:membrane peptidoglycan carboxypeptidase